MDRARDGLVGFTITVGSLIRWPIDGHTTEERVQTSLFVIDDVAEWWVTREEVGSKDTTRSANIL